ncbi:MAG TPA: nucleoid-associated protein [Williamwhitmania sp.]|nr:nucleoid-associated protein [Williamwhitmania sp.]
MAILDFSEARLEEVMVHLVGSRGQDEELVLSNSMLDLSGDLLRTLLQGYFLSHFKPGEFYSFTHDSDVKLNEVYSFVSSFFVEQKNLIDVSQEIAKHLFYVSSHPNIKNGELYVASIRGCVVEGEQVDALGIFKSEVKENFLKVRSSDKSVVVEPELGTSINRLDKGCLIFNTEQEDGFKIMVVDSTNKSNDALYWKEAFLRVTPRSDSFYQTKNYLNLCKDFAREVFSPQNEVEKTDQLLLLNRTEEFFTKAENFDEKVFQEVVLEQPEVVEAFNDYKHAYAEMNQVVFEPKFEISTEATKKAKKFFKSVIKLDKRFHVYVHGGHEFMEKGSDPDKGMHFYKLYFENEE